MSGTGCGSAVSLGITGLFDGEKSSGMFSAGDNMLFSFGTSEGSLVASAKQLNAGTAVAWGVALNEWVQFWRVRCVWGPRSRLLFLLP